jgi:hypothetical protein
LGLARLLEMRLAWVPPGKTLSIKYFEYRKFYKMFREDNCAAAKAKELTRLITK